MAVELGLATRTVAPDQLMDEAYRLAQRLAAQPPRAIQGTKRVLNMHLARALSGAVQVGFAEEEATMRSEEHHRRIAALRERLRR